MWPCHQPMGNGLMSYRQQIPLLTNSWQYLLLSIHSPGPEALPSPLVSEQVLAIKQNSVDNKWHSRSLLQPHLKWTTKSGRARYTRGHLQSPWNLAEGRSDFKIWELQEWGPLNAYKIVHIRPLSEQWFLFLGDPPWFSGKIKPFPCPRQMHHSKFPGPGVVFSVWCKSD